MDHPWHFHTRRTQWVSITTLLYFSVLYEINGPQRTACPQISQYISTLFPNTESCMKMSCMVHRTLEMSTINAAWRSLTLRTVIHVHCYGSTINHLGGHGEDFRRINFYRRASGFNFHGRIFFFWTFSDPLLEMPWTIFWAHLCKLHGGLLCVAFCLSVCMSVCLW